MKILVLDNYDSFTYNLVHIIRELGYGENLDVYRNDKISLDDVARYDKIVLSPGPGIPSEAGIMPELIKRYASRKHIIGICLGHQAIAENFGASLYNMPEVLHGIRTPATVLKPKDPIFKGLPKNLDVAHYHSWAVERDSINGEMEILAEDEDKCVMALRHKSLPIYGLQFHPESVITDHGIKMMKNWLELPLKEVVKPSAPSSANMKGILNHLFSHQTLDKQQAKEILTNIAKGGMYNNSQVAAFLTVFIMRGITVEELGGFREAMLELCIPVPLEEFDPIDLCGTGGDGKNTFNVSTLASFVTAGAGVHVAKHGNYGVSSVSGSSNVVEYLGGKFTKDVDELKRQMERSNLCFLHAQLFHPAMKNVGPIRRELGVKTFFNMLGPMVNPAFPKKQLVGVFDLQLARLYGYLYQKTDKNFVILHSLDGYDEISLTADTKYLSNDGDNLVSPEMMGLNRWQAEDLHGGDTVKESARIFMNVLENQATEPQKQVVIANAAMAIHCSKGMSISDSVAAARESLESNKALESFKKFIEK